MAAEYTVIASQPYTYQDQTGRVVEGFRVWFTIYAYSETFFVNVPSLDQAVVKKAIETVVKQRKDVSTL